MAFSPPGQTRERVYEFVRTCLLAGRPPTVREVQAALGFSAVETARAHLNALVAAGRLQHDAGRARGYSLPRSGAARSARPPVLVPLLGQVQAGDLQLALESPDGYVAIEPKRHDPRELFALTVRGRSMTGAGILPGDVVIVRRQAVARDGEIVVALVGDEATVKQLRLRRGRIVLQPANARFRPIEPDPERVQILGRVIEVRRYLE